MRFNFRLFIVLLVVGLAGISSLLLLDLNGLIAVLPNSSKTEIPQTNLAFKLLSLIQPTILLAVAVLVGVALASKVGLSAPAAQAAAGGNNIISAIKPQIIPGVVGGLMGGAIIVLTFVIWKPFLPLEVLRLTSEFSKFVPLPMRLLYGGITEEILLRWGFMTLLVWTAWRLFQKGQAIPKPIYFVGAIAISSIIFGIGHLPIAFILFPEATPALILFIIIGNSIFGLIAGYLYWRKGLESAMIAHALAHVVMSTANYVGVYF